MKNILPKSILTILVVLLSAPSILLAAADKNDTGITSQVEELVTEVQQIALDDMLESQEISENYVIELEEKAYQIMAKIVKDKEELSNEDEGDASDKLIQCLEVIALYK